MDFLGPIVSTGELHTWQRLLTQAFGMEQAARQRLNRAEMAALWGVQGVDQAHVGYFQTPGTRYGIWVVQFDPPSPCTIRDPASGYDCDALKVIDFFTADFSGARARLERAGFTLKNEIAEYDTANGRVLEAHLWGPDDVVCALVAGSREFVAKFVTVSDRLVSEVHSVSAPVRDQPAVVRFYESLGFREVHRYEITDTSFQHLVGAHDPLHIRAINMGVTRQRPYLGIIHYGLPEGTYQSLAEHARLPRRGLAGVIVRVPHVAEAVLRCRDAGARVLAPVAEIGLEPLGSVIAASVRAPHGVLHTLIQPASAGGPGD